MWHGPWPRSVQCAWAPAAAAAVVLWFRGMRHAIDPGAWRPSPVCATCVLNPIDGKCLMVNECRTFALPDISSPHPILTNPNSKTNSAFNKGVIDRGLRPWCCHLGSYFKHAQFFCRYIRRNITCKDDVINIQHAHCGLW